MKEVILLKELISVESNENYNIKLSIICTPGELMVV